MKIIIFSLFLIFSGTTIAEKVTINCPTSDNYKFNGKQWTFRAEDVSDKPDPATHNYGKDFYDYEPYLKEIDQHTTYHIDSIVFHYPPSSNRAAKKQDGITLECNGTYAAIECGTGWRRWEGCFSSKSNMLKASLNLGYDYRVCMPVSDTSFECE